MFLVLRGAPEVGSPNSSSPLNPTPRSYTTLTAANKHNNASQKANIPTSEIGGISEIFGGISPKG